MVLGGAEGWTSCAEEGLSERGCWWWCSAYGWPAPRHGGFTLGRWCSPSAWGQGSFPGVRTGTSSFCWVPPPARLPRSQKHPSLHVFCFSFKGISQMMSAIFYSVTFTRRHWCSRVIPPGSHPKKPQSWLCSSPHMCSCAATMPQWSDLPRGHGEIPLLLSFLGLWSQLSSALINGKLSWLTLGW